MKVMCAGVCATEAGDARIRMHGVNGGDCSGLYRLDRGFRENVLHG